MIGSMSGILRTTLTKYDIKLINTAINMFSKMYSLNGNLKILNIKNNATKESKTPNNMYKNVSKEHLDKI